MRGIKEQVSGAFRQLRAQAAGPCSTYSSTAAPPAVDGCQETIQWPEEWG